MNPLLLLQNQAHRLMFVIDPQHPQDVRQTLDEWIKPLKGAQVGEWGAATNGYIPIWLPAPARLQAGKKSSGVSVFVRPLHQDLLNSADPQVIEEQVDAVVDARAGEAPFHSVVAGFLSRALAREGEASRTLALRYQKIFERLLRGALRELADDKLLHDSYLENYARFLELQESLVGAPGPETLSQNLELLARRLDRKKNWRLILRSEARGEIKGELFFLGTLRGAPVFLEQLGMDPGPLGVCAAALVASSMRRLVHQWETSDADVTPGHIVQEAFQSLPFPLLFLGEKGEVLQHNTAFVKMNLAPSRVGKLQEFDQVLTRDRSWTVRRVTLAGGQGHRVLYTFFPEKPQGLSSGGASGSQDLGIITSSIAHELNNPIAGLLAALELLRMDEHWDEESFTQLTEMKQGALRCKQLIETFLGFSRIKPQEGGMLEKDLLKRCFEQALHLQRFRMVESELRVTITHRQQHPFAYPLHAPTATMLAYLVLGEVMTAFHHLKLLERRSSKGLLLEAIVEEDADRFRIILNPAISVKQGLNSKLLQYLLQQERLSVEIHEDGALLFSHQNVLI
jgi:signal transduction histidine kinase